MERAWISGCNVSDAARMLLDLILEKRDKKVIYFHGWNGFGVTPVLRSILQNLSSMKSCAELNHHRLIYIDCSEWKNRRSLQRKIAEELKFDQTTVDMFDKQDEEDDFNGVDHASRDMIIDVSIMIDKTLREHSFIIIFLNGSDDELDLSNFGVPCFPIFVSNIMIWSFTKRSLTIQDVQNHYSSLQAQLRHSHLFVYGRRYTYDSTTSEFSGLLHEEAASIIARHPCTLSLDLTMVKDCCLYEMFLYYSFHRTTEFTWAAHASNYWICDGIIKGDHTMEISNALHSEIRWECDALLLDHVCKDLMKFHQDASFLVINDDTVCQKKPYKWVALTSKNLKVPDQDMKTIMDEASSLFVAFERADNTPTGLPDGLFKHCNNLGVLVLFCCAFNFASPPFLRCRGLRFLGLDRCTSDLTREEAGGYCMDWVFLYSLWVLDLRYTDWDEILAEGKIDLMVNLRELSIEGLKCWQYINQLQTRLSNLQRLRIVRPMQQANISDDTSNSFVDKTKLEVLDLSDNSDMKKLPKSISNASRLQVLLLDGCDGLENIDAPNELPSSLTSFSLDSYGPASHYKMLSNELPPESSRPERPSDQDKKDVKTSKISLQGYKQLRNLFLRGLSNLMELDLSGSALKVLDFGSMVVEVPRLKRLFLLGCEHLRAIKWGTFELNLELLCIDTRPGTWTQPSPAKHDPCRFHAHAVLADVRLARSLWTLIKERRGLAFHIHMPSSSYTIVDCGTIQQPEGTIYEMLQLQSQYTYRDLCFSDLAFMDLVPPARLLDRHVEITGGGHILDNELQRHRLGPVFEGLAALMKYRAESLHVHDTSISVTILPGGWWGSLRWCHVERCPSLGVERCPSLGPSLFPLDVTCDSFMHREVVCASELAVARRLWSKGCDFQRLQHLYLCSCPRLQYALPLEGHVYNWCASLKAIHVIHCGDLRHVFITPDSRHPHDAAMRFPALAYIFLHNLPMLRGICEGKMFAPKLQTVMIRGCFGLRRLPAVDEDLDEPARGVRRPRPTVAMEKDVWDALEWDGMDARHHPSYYNPPLHSRYYRSYYQEPSLHYYRRGRLLRGSVLR